MLPRPGVTESAFNRIQEGMTRAEVEGIFGRPCDKVWVSERRSYKTDVWYYDEGRQFSVRIRFIDERVYASVNHYIPPDALSDKIRRWLHLP